MYLLLCNFSKRITFYLLFAPINVNGLYHKCIIFCRKNMGMKIFDIHSSDKRFAKDCLVDVSKPEIF